MKPSPDWPDRDVARAERALFRAVIRQALLDLHERRHASDSRHFLFGRKREPDLAAVCCVAGIPADLVRREARERMRGGRAGRAPRRIFSQRPAC